MQLQRVPQVSNSPDTYTLSLSQTLPPGTAAHVVMSSKAFLSSSCTMALSRSNSRPSALRLHRCPPFLSAAVLRHLQHTETPQSEAPAGKTVVQPHP